MLCSVAELCFLDFNKVSDLHFIADCGIGSDVSKRTDIYIIPNFAAIDNGLFNHSAAAD